MKTAFGRDDEKAKRMVLHAINFITEKLEMDIGGINLSILFSEDYAGDTAAVHFQPGQNGNENGIFIPEFYQKEQVRERNIPIIIINWGKLSKLKTPMKDTFLVSVIVHELVHYYDYCVTYPSCIVERYGKVLENGARGSLEGYIGGYFLYRSELRAKFYQETYILTSERVACTLANLSKKATKIEASYYSLAHARGELLCWKSLLESSFLPDEMEMQAFLAKREQAISQVETGRYVNLAELFELEPFFTYCDSIKLE
ncbi:hypothetical protein ABHN11_13890 [Brevibacillus centrosporus]|uniref:hypothetical protein n=1 Tax=Brevibacillus centrosporus TaxID=54910 RepID=UPI0039861CA6